MGMVEQASILCSYSDLFSIAQDSLIMIDFDYALVLISESGLLRFETL